MSPSMGLVFRFVFGWFGAIGLLFLIGLLEAIVAEAQGRGFPSPHKTFGAVSAFLVFVFGALVGCVAMVWFAIAGAQLA